MADTQASVPSQPKSAESKYRSGLIFGVIGVFGAIVFGLIYLFVIAPTVPDGSLGWFLFSFATGLTMIVMPCTLPLAFVIVPLSMGKGIIRGLGMALAFGLGVAVMLSTYGIIAALLGGYALEFLGNDIEPIKNWVYFIAGSFALVFALSEIGLLNIHMPSYSGAAPAFIQEKGEFIKAFLLGLFLGNVGVGCPHPATPLILIEIATSGDVLYGWLMFLVHAIGRVLPLLLLALLAVLGVNGLNWLMAHKPAVERVTGWGMVYVAGFILTLGLFTHDWWVNSGIHNLFEAATQESFFNAWFNDALDQNVAHVHGLEEGEGLFGLPLEWGSYFLVLVWVFPIWWWYYRKKRAMLDSPAFKLQTLQKELDTVEGEIRAIEAATGMQAKDPAIDLATLEAQMDEIKKQRRALAKKAEYGESGIYSSETARHYEVKILGMQRNYFIGLTIVLALVFIYFLPTNFYLKSTGGGAGHDDHGAHGTTAGYHVMPDGSVMDVSGSVVPGAHQMPDGSIMLADGTTVAGAAMQTGHDGTPFTNSTAGLPEAEALKFVTLSDGEEYDVTAEYVQKEVGNRTLRMMAYNRSIPGPFIKVEKGATVYINFTNETDIDQTIHHHGLRLDNRFDGVPGVTQDVVKPGESFRYELYFPDEGMAWYHPHTRDDYGQELGLYGVYLIDPLEGDFWNPVNREVPLVLDDILIENQQIGTFYKDVIDHVLLGRFGNEFLVNGVTNYEVDIEQGETIRFQVTNTSNARTYRLSIPGVQMKVVGAEWGRFEYEEFADEFVISPAERVVFEAYFPEIGDFELINRTPTESFRIAEFEVEEAESVIVSYEDDFNTLRRNQTEADLFTQYREEYGNRAPDKHLLLTVNLSSEVDHSAHAHGATESAGHDDGHGDHGASAMDHSAHAHAMGGSGLDAIQWDDSTNSDKVNTLANVSWILRDMATGRESMDIPVADWTFKQGELVKVRLTNDVNADHVMQHPIHFHGQRFVVLSENGVLNQNMVWKDTALVLPGQYIDILVEMENLGEWMNHCHIAEHLHAGMMMQFRVEDETGYATGDDYRATAAPAAHSMPMSSSDSQNSMAGMQEQTVNATNQYSFTDTDKVDVFYRVSSDVKLAKAGREELLALSFTDSGGNPVNLSDEADLALTVSFVKSDGSVNFITYPGNTIFPDVTDDASKDDHGNDDGHDHSHSFLGINKAYAHGNELTDGHHEGNIGRSYTVPVLFPERGVYRGYVEFILSGEETPRVAYFDIEVTGGGFSVDDFGWSESTKWWVLFISSIILIIPLVLGVRRYVNIDNK